MEKSCGSCKYACNFDRNGECDCTKFGDDSGFTGHVDYCCIHYAEYENNEV